jgi:hypothetical protein
MVYRNSYFPGPEARPFASYQRSAKAIGSNRVPGSRQPFPKTEEAQTGLASPAICAVLRDKETFSKTWALHLPSAPKNSVRIDATPTDTMSSMLQVSA